MAAQPKGVIFDESFLKVKSSSYTFDSVILFERNISREFDVQLTVRVLPSRGKTVIKFIDLKINLCDGLQTSFINPLTKSLFAEMRKSSNIPYECPLVGNFTYTFKNFSLTEKNLPLYTPSVNYTFALLLWEKARMVANFTLLGSVQN
ncbi:uncharacterized protein LOC142239494 [Haematobia irritans]|uniref:uncharacterized protein LOC142239494 n=1 Tax=Haematobia irritans TaxID=7368 RepID=UPI003F4FE46F